MFKILQQTKVQIHYFYYFCSSVLQYFPYFVNIGTEEKYEDKPKEQKPVLDSLQSKTTLCSAVAQLSFSCRAQLFHCC